MHAACSEWLFNGTTFKVDFFSYHTRNISSLMDFSSRLFCIIYGHVQIIALSTQERPTIGAVRNFPYLRKFQLLRRLVRVVCVLVVVVVVL